MRVQNGFFWLAIGLIWLDSVNTANTLQIFTKAEHFLSSLSHFKF